MVTAFKVPPANTPEREEYHKTVFGTIDRKDGGFYCLTCHPIEMIEDPCKVYGINISFYSQVCHGCDSLVVDGVKTAKDGVSPLSLYDPPAKNVVEIEISRRSSDNPKYMANIKGQTKYWDCGSSRPEALGNLIQSHPEQFNIKIDHKPE